MASHLLPGSGEPPDEEAVRVSVEARRTAEAERDELAFRLRQQQRLAELGHLALREGGLDDLLGRAAELCAKGMDTELCKVLHWKPEEDRFLVCAGVGWNEGVVGRATVGADMDSPAGYALKTGAPVVSNDLASETRFRTPSIVKTHGVRRAVNALIPSHDRRLPFGVIEVDSRREGRFDAADIHFMTAFADMLGLAIGRRTDEAERVRLINEIDSQRAQSRAVLDQLPHGVTIARLPSGELVFNNARALQLLADAPMPAAPDEGYPGHGALHPDGTPYRPDEYPIARTVQKGVTIDQEPMLYRRADGELIHLEVSASPVLDDRGRAVLAVSTFCDVSERMRMARSLRDSEERLRLIIESLNDYAIITTDSQGRITSWSPGACSIFGFQAEEVLGRPADLLFTPEDQAAGEPQRELETARNEGRASDQRWHVRRDGRRVFLNGSLRPLGDGPEATRFLKVAQDETARRRTEELQQHLARELSHRVKNSLQLVAGLLALQSRTVGDERARTALADARARIQTVAQVHDQLWRQDSAADIELSGFLDSLLAKLRASQPACALEFKGEPSIISTDRAVAIGLIVTELVTNAFKYACGPASGRSESDAGAVRVTLSRPQGGALRLEVADNGAGLPPGFDPRKGGSSLGMRIVTGLTDQLRGRLEVADNAPGARFAVEFASTE